ncbi:MAG: L-threonylcarbamoyladenylate synthase, partial [Bdellovibrionota bacterium]
MPFIATFEQALEELRNNRPVGLPTETVYGLAAPVRSPIALGEIFAYKKRPLFDPLIVHVADIPQAQGLVKNWNEPADILAKEFWPGPLTIVLEKNALVLDVITSGLPTVGLRSPDHPLTL